MTQPLRVSAALLSALALLTAGCGGSAPAKQARAPQTDRAACPPARAIRGEGPTGRIVRRLRLPEDVATARLCVYGNQVDGLTRLQRAVRLDPSATRTLKRLLAAPPGRKEAGCLYDEVAVVVLTVSGARRDFQVGGCDPVAYLGDGRRRALVGRLGATALEYLTAAGSDRGAPTPAVAGRTLTAAATALPDRGSGLTTFGELVDPSVPFGTILWQTPLPGTPNDADPPQAGVLVAVGAARDCSAAQLTVRFLGIARATGNVFGGFRVVNRSGTPCALGRTLRIEGLDAAGRTVTSRAERRVIAPGVLSPAGSGAELIARFTVVGSGRDDPEEPDGQCRTFARPRTWLLTLSGGRRLRTPNRAPEEDASHDSFASCHGGLGYGSQIEVGRI